MNSITPDVDPDIYRAIHDIAAKSHEPWIRALTACLTFMAGAARGNARKQIEHLLMNLPDHPMLAEPASAQPAL